MHCPFHAIWDLFGNYFPFTKCPFQSISCYLRIKFGNYFPIPNHHYSVVSRSLPALAPGKPRGSSLSRLMRLGMDDERWDEVPERCWGNSWGFYDDLTIEIEILNIRYLTLFNYWNRNSLRIGDFFYHDWTVELLGFSRDFLRDSTIWTYEYLNIFNLYNII
jgi:hypothetical protein